MSNDRRSKKTQSQAKTDKQIASLKRQALIAKNKAAYYKAEAKSRERELKYLLKNVRGKGIYEPRGTELTRYRKSRLMKVARTFGDLFDPKQFTFISVPKREKKTLIERLVSLDLKTTKTGVFIPKKGHQKVSLKKDKKRDEYYIEKSGKTKWGINQGRRYHTITPLASVDELEKETERLLKMAEKLGPLKKNERLSFVITEKGNEGASTSTFSNINLLLKGLDHYRKTHAGRIQFLRHIKVVKTSSAKQWREEHPPKATKRFGRSIFTKMSPTGRNE